MGQSAGLIWREVVEGGEDDDDLYGSSEQPEFRDPSTWAEWLVAVASFVGSEQDLADLGCRPLATVYVQEMEPDEVEWTTPDEVLAAADRLQQLIQTGNPSARDVINAYAQISGEPAAASDTIVAELEAAKEMVRWAKAIGKTQIAFEIG